ncbi:uncharacterized protein MYCFIDRAFT_173309 [Pseudocercospora fijiensis CIRAD86]|uniref:Uncharacterized protein n=1 Tax=Pseudocercospora fijiensis (strain CIRAD86) TaxID=383855 RepID=M2Z394_PSEFD|nr:uncharacterized protein MYCFIDRAFT_173309 [Pseudocercospora fijiensis CIRAD86]EME84290.1 hypothetical protein MYCFIDRAFT_173309 [Pseudocercospora fijiensis CIRAD86]
MDSSVGGALNFGDSWKADEMRRSSLSGTGEMLYPQLRFFAVVYFKADLLI